MEEAGVRPLLPILKHDLRVILRRESRGGPRLPVLLRRQRCVSHRQCWLCQHSPRQGRVWQSVSLGLNQARALKVSRPCLLSMHKVCTCAAGDRAFPPLSLCQIAPDQRSFEVFGRSSSHRESVSVPGLFDFALALLWNMNAYFILVHWQKKLTHLGFSIVWSNKDPDMRRRMKREKSWGCSIKFLRAARPWASWRLQYSHTFTVAEPRCLLGLSCHN